MASSSIVSGVSSSTARSSLIGYFLAPVRRGTGKDSLLSPAPRRSAGRSKGCSATAFACASSNRRLWQCASSCSSTALSTTTSSTPRRMALTRVRGVSRAGRLGPGPFQLQSVLPPTPAASGEQPAEDIADTFRTTRRGIAADCHWNSLSVAASTRGSAPRPGVSGDPVPRPGVPRLDPGWRVLPEPRGRGYSRNPKGRGYSRNPEGVGTATLCFPPHATSTASPGTSTSNRVGTAPGCRRRSGPG